MEKEALLYYRKDESMRAELIPSTFSFIWIWGVGVVLQVQFGLIISLRPTLGVYSIMIEKKEVNRNKTKSNQTKLQTKLNSVIVWQAVWEFIPYFLILKNDFLILKNKEYIPKWLAISLYIFEYITSVLVLH